LIPDKLIDRIKAHNSAPTIYDAPDPVEMAKRILADADVIERWRSMWEKEQTHNEQLIAERDHYKARAERAEEALYRIQNMSYGKNAAIARATLAQIDAEPSEP